MSGIRFVPARICHREARGCLTFHEGLTNFQSKCQVAVGDGMMPVRKVETLIAMNNQGSLCEYGSIRRSDAWSYQQLCYCEASAGWGSEPGLSIGCLLTDRWAIDAIGEMGRGAAPYGAGYACQKYLRDGSETFVANDFFGRKMASRRSAA